MKGWGAEGSKEGQAERRVEARYDEGLFSSVVREDEGCLHSSVSVWGKGSRL